LQKKVARQGTLGKGRSVTLDPMEQQQEQEIERPEDKPGYGVDRTQIRERLALPPEERVRLFVASARNVAKIREYILTHR
jgi:hypothetical protein